ncbi:Sulfotransferase [Candidatus Magnetomorum sp. HK-1]|nr:Sulfotransferase [Candidatus Magnetomorum sp. HK-1]
MAKIVVIDGLARSGTTLLTSFLHTQKSYAAFRGAFHEPQACLNLSWPHEYTRLPLLDSSEKLKLNCFQLKERTLNAIKKHNQTGKMNINEWGSLPIENCKNVNELDLFYQKLAEKLSVNVLCFRWNQGLPYIFKWLRNPNHYWICIIRNPMDRALSSLKTHQWSFEDSLHNSVHYYTMMSNLTNTKKVIFTYYEDIVKNPRNELIKITQKLGISLPEIELVHLKGQDEKIFRPERSDNIEKYGDHRKGDVFTGFYQDSINRYLHEMQHTTIEKYIKSLSHITVLKKYFANYNVQNKHYPNNEKPEKLEKLEKLEIPEIPEILQIHNLEEINNGMDKKHYIYNNVQFLTNSFKARRLIVIFHGTRANMKMPIFRGYNYFFKDAVVISISDPVCELYPELKKCWFLDTHKINVSKIVIDIVSFIKQRCGCNDILFSSNCSGALFALKLACILNENLLIANPHLVLNTTSHWTKESIEAGYRMPLKEDEIRSGKRVPILNEKVKQDPDNFFLYPFDLDAIEITKIFGLPKKIFAITHKNDYTREGMERISHYISSNNLSNNNYKFIYHNTPTDSPHHTPFPPNLSLFDFLKNYDSLWNN